MKFEHTEVWGFKHAIRGMRNPLKSHQKSDSDFSDAINPKIGECDMALMQKLVKGGSEHRKFMRQIHVSVDITAPRYWWSEFDTYSVGVSKNSESTMHTIKKETLTIDMFTDKCLSEFDEWYWESWLVYLNTLIKRYNDTKNEDYFRMLKKALPEGFLQKRTVDLNYENLYNIYHQRKSHRLPEWSVEFIKWVQTLPYSKELIIGE